MIQELLEECHKLINDYEDHLFCKDLEEDGYWLIDQLENLVERYETELNIQSLKEMQTKPFDPAVNDSIKDMEEEERAFPSDKE